MEKCIGCELCAGVCPAKCIYVRGKDNPPDAPVSPGERFGFVYEINYLRCIHCDLCVEACPTEAITESKLFEFSFTNRDDAIYTRDELIVDDDGKPKQMPWEDWREGDDEHTSAWMRATAPGGDPDVRGQAAVVGRTRLRRAAEAASRARRPVAETAEHVTPTLATMLSLLAATKVDNLTFVLGALDRARRRDRRRHGAQPGARRAAARADAVRRRRCCSWRRARTSSPRCR